MSTKPKIEAVPMPAQLLREAIAHRDSSATDVNTIRAKADHFAPIEAQVRTAESELNGILSRDAEAMQAWVINGAKGTPPEPDHKAREAAARKLSEAGARLSATGAARSQIDAEVAQAQDRHRAAQQAVQIAESDVLGREFILSAHAMKDAARAYLTTEYHYFNTRVAMFAKDFGNAGVLSEQAQVIGAPLNVQQDHELAQQTLATSQQRFAALLRGEELAARVGP
jgi:hypothetical protein